jgi:hypothetical protein
MFGLVVAFALAAGTEPAASQPSRNSERICRGGGQRTLGSHIRTRRRCMTAEEWQREDEARTRPVPGLQVTPGQNDGRVTVQPR